MDGKLDAITIITITTIVVDFDQLDITIAAVAFTEAYLTISLVYYLKPSCQICSMIKSQMPNDEFTIRLVSSFRSTSAVVNFTKNFIADEYVANAAVVDVTANFSVLLNSISQGMFS